MSTAIEDRQIRRRLAILQDADEVTGNVAMTCRHYDITLQTFYIWKRRNEELGEDGLKDRSRRPKTSPNAIHVDIVGKILYLRQNYHLGPSRRAGCPRHTRPGSPNCGALRHRCEEAERADGVGRIRLGRPEDVDAGASRSRTLAPNRCGSSPMPTSVPNLMSPRTWRRAAPRGTACPCHRTVRAAVQAGAR